MEDYDCMNCRTSYKSMNCNRGSYSGKDDYASTTPNVFMSDYSMQRKYIG